MSFPRHREIYPSDGGASREAGIPPHRLDEIQAGYSFAGWSPPETASASPTGCQSAEPVQFADVALIDGLGFSTRVCQIVANG